MLIEEGTALGKALRVRVDGVDILDRRARHAQKVVLDLDQLLADDGAVILHDEVIDFSDAAGRGVLDRNDAVVDGAFGDSFEDILKERVVVLFPLSFAELALHGFIRVRALRAVASDAEFFHFIGHSGTSFP